MLFSSVSKPNKIAGMKRGIVYAQVHLWYTCTGSTPCDALCIEYNCTAVHLHDILECIQFNRRTEQRVEVCGMYILFATYIVVVYLVGMSFAFHGNQQGKNSRNQRMKDMENNNNLHDQMLQPRQQFELHIDDATVLTTGTASLPPMVSVPCRGASSSTSASTSSYPLTELIKPPNVDVLYDWYVEQRQTPDADPSWGVLWPTAVALAQYLIDQNQQYHNNHNKNDDAAAVAGSSDANANVDAAIDGRGTSTTIKQQQQQRHHHHHQQELVVLESKHVVELGCGLGLCGLVAATLGASSVLISDREPYALHCALATAAVNKITNIKAAILDWNTVTTSTTTSTAATSSTGRSSTNNNNNNNKNGNTMIEPADVILASDVLYDKESIQAFANACQQICKEGGVILVADPLKERVNGARDMFRNCMMTQSQQQQHEEQEQDSTTMEYSHASNRCSLFEIVNLPMISMDDSMNKDSNYGGSMDARDHAVRMREPTVLIKCILA